LNEHLLAMDRVRSALAAQCDSDVAALRARALQPLADAEAALASMARIQQGRAVVAEGLQTTIHGELDVAPLVELAGRGGVLGGEDLLRISAVARCAEKMADRAESWREHAAELADLAGGLPILSVLADLADDVFEEDGTLRDDASDELARLRKEIRRRSSGLRNRIADLVRETDDQGVLQDDYFTVRDGRYVLPVKSSDRRQVAGIVHGSSQTGQTIYIEPTDLVEANNKLTMVAGEARREEHRILAQLSGLVAEKAPAIGRASDELAGLDGIFAGARLAERLQASTPRFSEDGHLDLRRARHPVLILEDAAVVANDVTITPPRRWLVVSGPNGGGKTVVLTTAGMAVEMARRGLPVCADEGSILPWLGAVHVVLGDAQDLDRGLSTFSGHLEQVRAVLDATGQDAQDGPPPLVLLDELASGTEPSAGSALATAFLEALADRRCLGLVTTHYETVKLLALRDDRFGNAALDLNPNSLAPDFRLRLDEVGSSSPFALADRLALPHEIVDRARELAGVGSKETEELLDRLRTLRGQLDQQLKQTADEHRQVEQARRRLEDQRRNEKRAADRRIEHAAGETIAELDDIRSELNATRKQLRKQPSQRKVDEAARAAGQARARADAIRKKAQAQVDGSGDRPALDLASLQVDAPAWHPGLERLVVITEIDAQRGRLRVRAGPLEMAVSVDELRAPRGGDSGRPKASTRPEKARPADDPARIDEDHTLPLRTERWTCDLRGMRVEEALMAVDRHLDRAIVEAGPGACVVHGIGTGALRNAVQGHLRGHPQVAHYRLGRKGEGGAGVTMVWVKQ